MNQYLNNITTALVVFPILAAIMTLPYVMHQYRKYGAVIFLRVGVVYSFVLYMLCAFFMIILPLPQIKEVANWSSSFMQLVPFNFITDFVKTSGLVIGESATYLPALKSGACFTVLFNVAMLVPFGVYMRYYFKKSWKQTLLLTFLLSLFYEMTQLTGLYFIYPRPYRLFDVDDLIVNTLGGMIGFLITPLFALVLPSREKLDKLSYKKGRRVTLTRRIVAACTDWSLIFALQLLLTEFTKFDITLISIIEIQSYESILAYCIIVILYFMALPWVLRGRTFGKMLVKIRLRTETNENPRLYQYVIRYGMLYFLAVPSPFIMVRLINELGVATGSIRTIIIALVIGTAAIFTTFVIRCFISALSKEPTLMYGKISNTENVSTVVEPKKKSTEKMAG